MKHEFWMKRPASWWGGNWREGTPLGNGVHGALLYGYTAHERVMLSHTRLWRGDYSPPVPDVSGTLPKMRETLLNGGFPEGDPMLVNALYQAGYAPKEAFPYPAADLLVSLPSQTPFSHYRRSLKMETGEGRVSYRLGEEEALRRCFVSRADDVVVLECNRDSQVEIGVHMPDAVPYDPAVLPQNVETRREGEWLFFKAFLSGKEHGAVARVVRGERTLVIARVYTEGTSVEKWPEYQAYIRALPTDYDTLFQRHAPLHRELFNRCKVELDDLPERFAMSNEELLDLAWEEELPNALAQRMWEYGRYLLISATAENSLPCNLTGLWSGDYKAFWAFNMANINLEMTYWQALPGNLEKLALPFFDYFDRGMEAFRENARRIYGCRGIFVPAVSMPGCMRHVCMAPHITNWTGGAGWVAQHYYDYWVFTRDREFLENRALPFLREAAAFYEDFVIWQGEGWMVCPSVSPENHTSNYLPRSENGVPYDVGDPTQASINAAMDVAIIREVFTHLLAIGKDTGLLDGEEAARYERMLAGSPEYQLNEYGAPREWLHPDFPDNDRHRHQSHLYPMFPGLEKARQSPEDDAAYRQGGLRRMTEGIEYQTSWSLTQNACLMARVRDGELAFQSLNFISKAFLMRNLFTTHNDWRGDGIGLTMASAPFQIDANTGWPAAVQEMLLFSNEERVDILPALPAKWKKGSAGPMLTRCGAAVSFSWDGDAYSVKAEALRDTSFRLFLPDGTQRSLTMKKDEVLTFQA